MINCIAHPIQPEKKQIEENATLFEACKTLILTAAKPNVIIFLLVGEKSILYIMSW